MSRFEPLVGVLQTLVLALGAGLGIWGAINLLEGYGKPHKGIKRIKEKTAASSDKYLCLTKQLCSLSSNQII